MRRGLFCIFLLGLSTLSLAAVLGVDFGSEFIKIASAKPGKGIHIIVDEQSKRKVPAVITFDDNERLFGNGATSTALRKPQSSYAFIQTILGRHIDSPAVTALRNLRYPYEFVPLENRTSPAALNGKTLSAVGLRHDADQVFAPEELVAMNFQHVKKIAEADAEAPVKDCVIVVPAFFTQNERFALMHAAEIAGLNVLSLVNENTAAAVQYGIDRTYTGNETHTIMLYNMGTTSTQVSIITYSSYAINITKKDKKVIGQMDVRAVAWDEALGGRDFEAVLMDHLGREFMQMLKKRGDNTDIFTKPKAVAKLREAAVKAKTVLSANVETLVAISAVYDDLDFKLMITRDKFLELAAPLLQRVAVPMQKALEDANIPVAQLDKVIIIGGGTRVPAVQAALKAYLKRETLDQNLNSDDSAAMGAAFMAANMSAAFRVRPFGLNDITPFAVGVRLADLSAAGTADAASAGIHAHAQPATEDDKVFSKRATLFSRHNRLNKRRTVAFTHDRNIQCAMFYDNAHTLPAGESAAIALYNVTGVEEIIADPKNKEIFDSNPNQKPRISLKFFLDMSGLVELVAAEATLEQLVKVPVERNDTKDANSTEPAPAAEEKKEEEFKLKPKLHSFILNVAKLATPGAVPSMSYNQLLNSRQLLKKLQKADEFRHEVSKSKNAVESFIYNTRSKLYDEEAQLVSTEEQRQKILDDLSEAEDWLSATPEDGPEKYVTRLKTLETVTASIMFRIYELKERPAAIEAAANVATTTRELLEKFAKERPWVTEEERKELADALADVEQWMEKKLNEQNNKPLHESPAFTSEEVYNKLRNVARIAQTLSNKKKPKEEKKKEETKQAETKTSENPEAKQESKSEQKTEAKPEGETPKEETNKAEAETKPERKDEL